ncbi:hypothetical protein C8N42_1577 [Celeribacter persicus]|nr:hypothetical protein C8N42_1577 [Celeribacter persicus]
MRSAYLAVISSIGLIGLGATWWFSGNASQGSSPFDDV